MRRLAAYGFEGGDLYSFTTAGTTPPTVQNSHVLSGSYSAEVNVASGANGYVTLPINGSSTALCEFFHVAVEFVAIPTVRTVLCRINNTGAVSSNPELAIETSGKISWGLNNASVNIGNVVLSAGVKYELEVMIDHLGGYWATRINGELDIDFTANASINSSQPTGIFFG